ncbi:MAG: WYL domain-containing protein [Phycisphaerales bacterium]
MESTQTYQQRRRQSPDPPTIVVGRVARLIRLIGLLRSTTDAIKADELAVQLGVSRRTIFRDLKLMQKAGVTYTSVPGQGYRIDPDAFTAQLDLGPVEALGLMLLAKLAEAAPNQPLFRPAASAIAKMIAQLPAPARTVYQDLMSSVSISPGAVDFSHDDDEHYRSLQYCIEERKVCRVVYDQVDPKKRLNTKIQPLHLHFYKRACYVLAFSEHHDEVRMFKLARIVELEPTDEDFAPFAFSIEDYLDDAWGIIPGDRKYDVVIDFSKRVTSNVTEVQWHRTQQTTLHSDGSCQLRFCVNGLQEIKWWVLGYGDEALVRKPLELRQAVQDLAQRTVRKYDEH